MQNIQDLQESIFFEFKNIVGNLENINSVEELISKQELVNKLAEKVSFLKLLKENTEYYQKETTFLGDQKNSFSTPQVFLEEENTDLEIEEEAIFNNKLNEIGEFENNSDDFSLEIEEEAEFNNQLNEISDNDDENNDEELKQVLNFVDEERILENSEPEDDDITEEIFDDQVTEEEALFNNQLNEIEDSEAEISEENTISEEEAISNENEADFKLHNDEIVTESSTFENVLSEIKNEAEITEETVTFDKRKIADIEKPAILSDESEENKASDKSFEDLDAYQQEKKIKLANIKGLKGIQNLFDDDPLNRDLPTEKKETTQKENSGSLLKSNIPTEYMEADKAKPEFKLDLNDRMAFTKVLFGGSQTDLNIAITELNRCRTLDEAKEYLSDLYYDRDWEKVDEYAQRLWVLIENKFL